MDVNQILTAIRRRSDEITRPDSVGILTPADLRVAQLQAMTEIVDLLVSVGVEVPAIVHGFIKAEIERLS